MRKFLFLLVVSLLGLGVGAAGALATHLVIARHESQAREDAVLVPTGTILAPLVFPDGRLAGYVNFEAQIEVRSDRQDDVKQHMPLLLDAVNMRTYRAPLASGRDGLIPGVDAFRKVLFDAAVATFGKNTVRRAVVTQAMPA